MPRTKSSKRTAGVLLAPVLLFFCSILIFSIALLPYTMSVVSAASVFFVNPVTTDSIAVSSDPEEYPTFGSEMGSIEIPALGINYPVYQGDTLENLEKGVGHFYGSGMPGEGRTVLLTGHRNTHFTSLGNLQVGDQITVNVPWGSYVYQMTGSEIIYPADESYLEDTGSEQLVLLTCYPFDYVGSAPQRYVVYASLISGEPHEWWSNSES